MTLHVCNPYFETELKGNWAFSLEEAGLKHPIFTQLQLLPLLYGAPEEGIIVSAKPDAAFFARATIPMPRSLYFPDEPLPSSYHKVVDWGASELIAGWASQKGLSYATPPLELVRQLSSKLFSFQRSPLPGSQCIGTDEELRYLLKKIEQPTVLKNCEERAGRGHFFLFPEREINERALKAFLKEGYPFIAEPWVDRVGDFSTQWEITRQKEIRFLGNTICHNDAFGKYLASEVGHPTFIADSSFHRILIEEIAEMGFFGNIGIDAMHYRTKEGIALQPVVEINPRKTMGYVALALQKRHFPHQHLMLSFTEKEEAGLLPFSVTTRKGVRLKFRKTVSLKLWKSKN